MVYGLNDAGRKWYLRVERAMFDLGCRQSKLDTCLFFKHCRGELLGFVLVWVDDFFHAGNPTFEKEVAGKIQEIFCVGKVEEDDFTYTGIHIEKVVDGILIDQDSYIENLVPAVLSRTTPRIQPLDKKETTLLKRMTGQVNWAATQTRPDLSFAVVEQSVKYKDPTVGDLVDAAKSVWRLGMDSVKVLFPRLPGQVKIVTFSDAAFRNLPDQVSSGRGHIVFLTGEEERSAPLAWTSNKVRRVVGSTLAAEALSFQKAIDHSFYLRAILSEILQRNQLSIPIIAHWR